MPSWAIIYTNIRSQLTIIKGNKYTTPAAVMRMTYVNYISYWRNIPQLLKADRGLATCYGIK